MKIVKEFICPQNAVLQHFHTFEEGAYEDDQDFCVRTKRRGETIDGRTRIKRTTVDELDDPIATITAGRYNGDQRHGLWITIFEFGQVIQECFYNHGTVMVGLLDGDDTSCPYRPFPVPE
jgi:hypothetical protein